MGNEFAAYYKAVEENPNNKDRYVSVYKDSKAACIEFLFDRYQWFCHCDDDVYVNIPQLSQHLQQYDPHKPYYIGKWSGSKHRGLPNVHVSLIIL